MDQLQQARAQIDEIDAKMAALFEQRMQAVGQVAQYKARTGKQVFDPAREALVLEKNTARVQNPELQPYYREFLKKALAVSRAYQHVLIGQDVAAYQGVEGAWSHIALRQLFPFCQGTGVLHLERGGGSRGAGAMLTAAFCRLKIPTRAMFPLCWTCCMPTPA
ncbi:MAG: chorismate mutase [Subdoligranulum sp.]